jgi:chitin disaccharide deacetylase
VPRLIVNADDLGLTDGVNDGVIEAHERGIVTSASLMVSAPAATEAAGAARAHPDLSIGLHFVEDRAAVLDDAAALAAAFEAQLRRFRELLGREPTHVDSHHHVHMTRIRAFAPLVAQLGVPLRGDGSVGYVGDFYAQLADGQTDLSRITPERLLELVRAQDANEPIELGCHPGVVTDALSSSYREPRAVELAALTAPDLREALERAGFELVGFADARGARTA